MNHQEVMQPPDLALENSPPSLRVHQRLPQGGGKNKTDGASNEKNLFENFQPNCEQTPQTEHSEVKTETLGAQFSQQGFSGEVLVVSDSLNISKHECQSTSSKQIRFSEANNEEEASKCFECSGNDILGCEFPILQVKLASPVLSPSITSTEDKASFSQLNICLEHTSVPFQNTFLNCFSVVADTPRQEQSDQIIPVEVGQTHSEPKFLKHEVHMPEVSKVKNADQSNETLPSHSGTRPQIPVHNIRFFQIPRDDKVAQEHIQEDYKYETSEFRQTSLSVLPPLILKETARPIDFVLSPTSIPQITLQRRPITSLSVHKSTFDSIYYKPLVPLFEDASVLQLSPPPYTESTPVLPPQDFLQQAPHHSQNYRSYTSFRKDTADFWKLCPELGFETPYRRPFDNRGRVLDTNVDSFPLNRPPEQRTNEKSDILESDHQLLAFISCLFCWPIGLVAIYYSNMCQMLRSEGNYAQSQVYARQAFIISTIAMCAGSVIYIIMFIYERLL